METNNKIILSNFLIKEFEKLKDEQSSRIGFRDQMIFITLAGIGGITSFAIANPTYLIALLLIPFVCFVLGWTYIINDYKISQISVYIENELSKNIKKILDDPDLADIFSWEKERKKDVKRRYKKLIQLIVDLFIFTIPGFASILFYLSNTMDSTISLSTYIITASEAIITLVLGYQILIFTDFIRTKRTQ